MPISLFDGEPDAGPWCVALTADVLARLLAQLDVPPGRPIVLAVDGGSGSGKTVLASRLATAGGGAPVIHADDLSWNHAFFAWTELFTELVAEVRQGEAVSYRPPAWDRHGRAGEIAVPSGARLVIIEGVGSARRDHEPLLDGVVWVQSDRAVADRRGIQRDGGDAAAADFWAEWMAAELPFLAADRPWDRADLIVSGTPVQAHDPETELLVSARSMARLGIG
jgi:hypothetical protein